MSARLDTACLHACLAELPTPFCDPAEAAQVQEFLVTRRDQLYTSVATWWDTNVAPLHVFDHEALARAIRAHMR